MLEMSHFGRSRYSLALRLRLFRCLRPRYSGLVAMALLPEVDPSHAER